METLQMKLNRLAKESEKELIGMGFATKISNKHRTYTVSNARRRLGQCCNKKDINISKWLLEIASDKEIKNTIIHEILHTFDDTKGHNARWQHYARLVNNYGVYNITRLANTNEIMNNNNVNEEYRLELMNYKYEITCEKCGKTFYLRRLNATTIESYKRHNMIHKSCGGTDFIVKDLKTNKIIVGG